MPSFVTLRANGLQTQPNSLATQDGSLHIASNVVIRRDGIIEPRRGFKLYGTPLPIGFLIKQLFSYKNRLFRHYNNKIEFQDKINNEGEITFKECDGEYLEPEEGIRIKSIESNGNLYLTTDDGIKKISLKDESDFKSTNIIKDAGVFKALDISGELDIQPGSISGYLPQDSTVAYRVVWGIRDKNNNLILGTPSQRLEIYNPLTQLIIRDFNYLLSALDLINQSGSLINDGNYVLTYGVNLDESILNVRLNIINTAYKLDNDILYANDTGTGVPFKILNNSIAISAGTAKCAFSFNSQKVDDYFDVGSKITLSGFIATGGDLNQIQTINGVVYKAPQNFNPANVNVITNRITINNHGLEDGDAVVFNTTGTLPAPLNLNTVYYVKNPTLNDFELMATPGGATIDITTQGIGTHSIVSNYITFATTVTGTVIINNPKINSGEYSSISQPPVPSIPASNQELVAIQNYLKAIINKLKLEKPSVIPASLMTTYITPLNITTSTNVKIKFNVPVQATTDHFYQIYRSGIAQATDTLSLSDVVPNDELQLVYEAFPTEDDIKNGEIEILDNTPEVFKGAFLYTNAATGEGILQANDIPPFAKDINKFKNVVFYANTRTKHKKIINLLGVSKLIEDYNNSIQPSITIIHEDFNNINNISQYNFVIGKTEITKITCNAASTLPNSGTGGYLLINSANNKKKYYIWFNVDNNNTDPNLANKIGVEVKVNSTDSDTIVAQKLKQKMILYINDFSISGTNNEVILETTDFGESDDTQDVSTGFTITILQQGKGEKAQRKIQKITCINDVNNSLNGTYFLLNSSLNINEYYIWFKTSGGVNLDPLIPNKIGIKVEINTNDTASQIALKIKNTLNNLKEFIVENSANDVIITNYGYNDCNNIIDGSIPTGFTFTNIQNGVLDVLLYDLPSPSQSVDQTARSLVRIINKNKASGIYAYYLSGANDVPGKMLFEARFLKTNTFYIHANNDNTGSSFNPDISGLKNITNITSSGNKTTITCNNHGFKDGETVIITHSNSLGTIDGTYKIFNVTTNTFDINKVISNNGTQAIVSPSTDVVFSENETKPNRIYYSKLQQPEHVPIVNYIDVGSAQSEIIRIFPLRDSLFVFKEDGLYRISGETAPFNVTLFDSSTILVAPDSLGIAGNLIYGFTKQGIVSVSEAGVSIASRPIDIDLLKLFSSEYPYFKKATFGVGYISDNAYYLWTIKNPDDAIANICYRYSTLTGTWTTFDKINTCGFINPFDDKMYLGAGDVPYIEQERKSFTRLDYADREIKKQISAGKYLNGGKIIKFNDVSDIDEGDVLVQVQTVTAYDFNSLLLKLDNDQLQFNDYYNTLKLSGGENLRSRLEDLAQKLDLDNVVNQNDFSTTIGSYFGNISNIDISLNGETIITTSTPHNLIKGRIVQISGTNTNPIIDGNYEIQEIISPTQFKIKAEVLSSGNTGLFVTLNNNFKDIKTCYNKIIEKLNIDTGVTFFNYQFVLEDSEMEVPIDSVSNITNEITLTYTLPLFIGDVIIYKAIKSEVQYHPIHFGDVLSFKQIYEATILFENKAFTKASLTFSSDLLPEFTEVVFKGQGNGIFGLGSGEFGQGFFGGASHSAPFRTIVPRNAQRCRFLNVKFKHNVAREKYSIYGITLTGNVQLSTRAYR
jgi:hypothetical protein